MGTDSLYHKSVNVLLVQGSEPDWECRVEVINRDSSRAKEHYFAYSSKLLIVSTTRLGIFH